jgi:hypothetical protein
MLDKTVDLNLPPPKTLGRNIYGFVVFFVVIALVVGCSGISRKTRSITRGFKQQDENMVKLIGMAPFNNRSRFSDPNLETNFSQTLRDDIKTACAGVHILDAGTTNFPAFLGDLPRQDQGGIDNLELAKAGRQSGLNAVLTIVLTGINSFEADKGWWFFKKKRYFIRTQMKVALYDTETGAKLLDEIIGRDIEVELFDIEPLENRQRFDVFLLEGAYEDFASTIAERVCDALTLEPWKGYIVSVTGDKIILSSGQGSGLQSGQVLEVFDSSQIIEGADSHRFFMPGPKTGEVTITAVYEDSAEAVLGTDSVARKGNVVKLKD